MSFKKPAEIAKSVVELGVEKTRQPLFKVFVLALMAGAFIALGAELSTIVSYDLGKVSVGLARFMAGSVFSIGLILVVIAGAELFTGNTLMIIPALEKKISLTQMMKNWGIVYVGNFVGSLFFVLLIFFSGIYKGAIATYAVEISANKVNLDFSEAFLLGIGCNWLVALAIWLALASDKMIGKIVGIYLPIMAFVASGFEHSIANMYFIPIGILLKNFVLPTVSLANLNWSGFLLNNLLPVTIGNVIGGAIFVGFVYWYVYLYKK